MNTLASLPTTLGQTIFVPPPSDLKRQTPRLVVRLFQQADFKAWRGAHMREGPKAHRFDYLACRLEQQLTKEFFTLKMLHTDKKGFRKFGAFERVNGENIGEVDLYDFSDDRKTATLGYQLHNQFWGRGYATEATEAVLQIGFGDLDLERIRAEIQVENEPSIRVVEKLGMQLVRVRSGHLIFVLSKGRFSKIAKDSGGYAATKLHEDLTSLT